jgi:predicted MFS family arabinose efflux permease
MVGLRTLWQIKPMRYGTLLMTVANMAGYFVEANLIYLGLRVEHLPKAALGLVFAGQGLGALFGALIAPRLVDRYATGRLLTLGMGGSGLAMLVPVFFPHWPAVVLSWGLEAIATSIIVVSWFTTRQHIVPAAVTGRVASVSRALAFAAIPFGAVIGAARSVRYSAGLPRCSCWCSSALRARRWLLATCAFRAWNRLNRRLSRPEWENNERPSARATR